MKPALLTIALCLAAPALAAEPAPATEAVEITDPGEFASALERCITSRHAAPHPFMKGFVIQHTITGEQDGACAYSQTMPGEMRMECQLSDAGRSGLAEDFREQAQGRMSGSTRSQPAWTGDCEIVTKDGKRSRLSGG